MNMLIPALIDQIALLRSQALTLAPQYSNLSSGYLAVQRESYACANCCHDAWSKASLAAYDDPYRSQSLQGFGVRQSLASLAVPQQRLGAATLQIAQQTPALRGKALALYNSLSGLIAAAGTCPAPLGAALAQAQRDLYPAAGANLDMNVEAVVQQAQALVNRAAQYNQYVEADAPGQDVSGYARAAMGDLQQAKQGWNQVAGLAGQRANQSLEVARLLRQVGASLEAALACR